MLGSRQGQIIGIRCLCPVILASRLTKVILLILTCSNKVWVLLLSNKIYKTKRLMDSCSQAEKLLNSQL